MKLLADVMLFVGELHSGHLFHWPCVVQQDAMRGGDAGQTRIKTKLDKIGTKKQEVEQNVILVLKPNRNWRHYQLEFRYINIKWSNISHVGQDNQMAVKHSPSSSEKEIFPSFVLDRKKFKFILCG